jgi:hypothetical protein
MALDGKSAELYRGAPSTLRARWPILGLRTDARAQNQVVLVWLSFTGLGHSQTLIAC